MARYRHKDDTDLSWNRIRRRITRELDTEVQNAREEILNSLLTKAWDDYAEALGEGKVPEVETKYTRLVTNILQDVVPKIAEGSRVEPPVE
jgi:methionyl-tRNA synthetase